MCVCVYACVLLLLLTLCVPVMGILQVTHLLNNLEFIIIPFVNPDGYVVSKSLKVEIHPLLWYFPAVYMDSGSSVEKESTYGRFTEGTPSSLCGCGY